MHTVLPARIPSSAIAFSRETAALSPAGRQAEPRQACWRDRRSQPLARTQAALCARLLRFADWSVIALPSGAAIGEAARTWRNRSTPWAGSSAIFEDAPLLADFFAPELVGAATAFTRFAVVAESFLNDCEPEIVAGLRATSGELETLGLRGTTFDADWWVDSFEIFAPIQAWEAARIHAGHFDQFEPAIRERLEWGAGIGPLKSSRCASVMGVPRPDGRTACGASSCSCCRRRRWHASQPAPITARPADACCATPRRSAWQACPWSRFHRAAGGMQFAAARGNDETLLQLAARLGARRNAVTPAH